MASLLLLIKMWHLLQYEPDIVLHHVCVAINQHVIAKSTIDCMQYFSQYFKIATVIQHKWYALHDSYVMKFMMFYVAIILLWKLMLI